jgi:hypothetical protein
MKFEIRKACKNTGLSKRRIKMSSTTISENGWTNGELDAIKKKYEELGGKPKPQ